MKKPTFKQTVSKMPTFKNNQSDYSLIMSVDKNYDNKQQIEDSILNGSCLLA